MAIRNWACPGSHHSNIRLNQTVDIGTYLSVRSPDDPILVHMIRTPCKPGLDQREQHRVGRAELLNTSFETETCSEIRFPRGRHGCVLSGVP